MRQCVFHHRISLPFPSLHLCCCCLSSARAPCSFFLPINLSVKEQKDFHDEGEAVVLSQVSHLQGITCSPFKIPTVVSNNSSTLSLSCLLFNLKKVFFANNKIKHQSNGQLIHQAHSNINQSTPRRSPPAVVVVLQHSMSLLATWSAPPVLLSSSLPCHTLAARVIRISLEIDETFD